MIRKQLKKPEDTNLIVLARHGNAKHNEIIERYRHLREEEQPDRYVFPHSDHETPLTKLGKQQALESGRMLAELFPVEEPIHRILVSPMKRAKQSCTQMRKPLDNKPKVITHPHLAERSWGELWSYSDKGIKKHFPEFWEKWQDSEQALDLEWPGGQTIRAFIEQQHALTHDVLTKYSGSTLVVTHSFAIVCIRVALEGLPIEEALRIYKSESIKNGELLIYADVSSNDAADDDCSKHRWERCPIPQSFSEGNSDETTDNPHHRPESPVQTVAQTGNQTPASPSAQTQ